MANLSVLETAKDPAGWLVASSGEHHNIHVGLAESNFFNTTLASSATTWMVFVTPTTTAAHKYVHLKIPAVWALGEVQMTLFENPGTYTGGSTLPSIAHNRNIAYTPGSAVIGSATVSATTTATNLGTFPVGGGGAVAGKVASFPGFQDEYLLAPGTVYGIKFENRLNATTPLYVQTFYYELASL